MKYLVYVFAILFAVILTGCSGKPSNSEIEKQVIENLLSDGAEEILTIEEFHKTNGYEKDSSTYIADVKYEIVFTKGLNELEQQLKAEMQASTFEAMQASVILKALEMRYGNFEAGHRVPREEKVTFIKTENGWLIE